MGFGERDYGDTVGPKAAGFVANSPVDDLGHMNMTPGACARDDGAPHADGEAGEILLVYDWECPACDAYCRSVRVSRSVGRLRLVNARHSTPVMKEITGAGLDIDQGMVVKRGGELHYGSDAIHALALLSSRADLFNKLNYYVFRSRAVSHILYPGLRRCRNLLLKAMGKTRINNLEIEGNDRF